MAYRDHKTPRRSRVRGSGLVSFRNGDRPAVLLELVGRDATFMQPLGEPGSRIELQARIDSTVRAVPIDLHPDDPTRGRIGGSDALVEALAGARYAPWTLGLVGWLLFAGGALALVFGFANMPRLGPSPFDADTLTGVVHAERPVRAPGFARPVVAYEVTGSVTRDAHATRNSVYSEGVSDAATGEGVVLRTGDGEIAIAGDLWILLTDSGQERERVRAIEQDAEVTVWTRPGADGAPFAQAIAAGPLGTARVKAYRFRTRAWHYGPGAGLLVLGFVLFQVYRQRAAARRREASRRLEQAG